MNVWHETSNNQEWGNRTTPHEEHSMTRQTRSLALLALGALISTGCAGRHKGFENLYEGLRERPEEFDRRSLAGRRIVIDPGHGGAFDGAMGVDSLREADANLGVALYLWGLCADAGAEAHLTRTADRDRLPAGSTEPGDDLRARADWANALDADAFVSIHHNANLPVKRNLNRIEVYYRSSDPGASLELAQDVEVHLARNLGIETSEVKPGNYLVLRHSTAGAAILGEASYLSHPAVEERLKLSEKQRLEAEAYFLGLVEYFSRGVPSLARLSPPGDTIDAPVEISFAVSAAAGVPIDPTSARITVGAPEIIASYDPATETLRASLAPDLPNGAYSVQATVRSTGGATARSKPFTLFIARPARHIVPLRPRPGLESRVMLSMRVLDELAAPVADGTLVEARTLGENGSYAGACRNGVFEFEVPPGVAREAFRVETRGLADTVRFAALDDLPRRTLIVTDARTAKEIPFPVADSDSGASRAGDGSGTIFVPADAGGSPLTVSAAGYRPALVEQPAAAGNSAPILVELEPLFGGVLRGARIALDPEGGGPDAAGRGANSLRAASVNLAVVRRLADLLERCGASVSLTRSGDEPISIPERIYLVNRSGAELALGLRHGKPPEGFESGRLVLHYPGSERGRRIAERLSSALVSLPPGGTLPVREWASSFLQQTAGTACELYCGPVENGAIESLMGDESWRRLEAERILAAIAQHFGFENAAAARMTVRVLSNGAPVIAAAVDIDRFSVRSTGPDGAAMFDSIEPGRHIVTVRAPDGRAARATKSLGPGESGELVVELR